MSNRLLLCSRSIGGEGKAGKVIASDYSAWPYKNFRFWGFISLSLSLL